MSAGYDDMEELGKKPSTMDLVSATKYLKILNICLETEDGEFIEYVKTRTEQIFGRPIVDITAGYIMHRVDVKDQLLGGEWTLLNKINNIRIDKKKRILELQRIPHHTKSHSVQPSSKYPSHDMFDFGSTMCPNTCFDSRFTKDESSVLLYISMHGELVLSENLTPMIKSNPNIRLNKYSVAGTGQCVIFSLAEIKYALYRICDSVSKNTPLDISTILRESLAFNSLIHNTPGNTRELFANTENSATYQHKYCMKKQRDNEKCRDFPSESPIGERVTYGNTYVEKNYQIDLGIFICNEWSQINAEPMDNLLENSEFKTFIYRRYNDPADESKIKNKFTHHTNLNGEEVTLVVETVTLSDILDFCEMHGRPNISMVDNSCSSFNSSRRLSSEEIARIKDNLSVYPNIAKGVYKKNKSKRINKKSKKNKQQKKDKRRRTKTRY